MKLLVSVSNAEEARAAVEGGADIVDAKDPLLGALGPVRVDVFAEIRVATGPGRPVTAALGDADAVGPIALLAAELIARGAKLVKVAVPRITDASRVEGLIARVVEACGDVDPDAGVVAVLYADAIDGAGLDRVALVEVAARAGARGVLVDTADKNGLGLTAQWEAGELASWISEVHRHGLFAAVAGKLRSQDLSAVRDAGADIAGVRGAACVGGRNGCVSADLVRALRRSMSAASSRVRPAASMLATPVP